MAICLLKEFGNLRDLLLQSNVLAHLPKSKFVETERKMKSLLFRHFIYVKLRIAFAVSENLLFTCKNASKPQKNTKFFCPTLDISMSGSPIIQDGKLVGAVTHVLVNDPTTGYGIFIHNMLDAAG